MRLAVVASRYEPPDSPAPRKSKRSAVTPDGDEPIAAELRDDVRLLGETLGIVLREQGGPGLFDLVEGVRHAAIAMRQEPSGAFAPDLLDIVAGLEIEPAINVVRAFATYFHLINVARAKLPA